MNEKEIEKIAKEESKIVLKQEYLYIMFFIAAAIVLGVIIWTFAEPEGPLGYSQVKAVRIFYTLLIFAGGIIAGYLYYRRLSKKLENCDEQRKAFI